MEAVTGMAASSRTNLPQRSLRSRLSGSAERSVARRPDEINAMDNRRSLIYRCIDLIEGGLRQVRSGHSGYLLFLTGGKTASNAVSS